MPKTPDDHIGAMKSFCADLESHVLIEAAQINDWGRFSNFDIHVLPSAHDRHTTRRLTALIKRRLKGTGAHLRDVFPPTAQYEWDNIEKRNRKVGYDRSFWVFDIDFMKYDKETNSFN